MLSATEEDRIEAAVTAAEDGTSGEIICVLAAEVSKYREVPLAWAAGIALALPPLALGVSPLKLAMDAGMWISGEDALAGELAIMFGLYAALQAALFIIIFLIAEIPAVRRRITPGVLKSHRVAKVAHQQFAAISARAAGSDTGVLIFVALDDRRVQILADAGIHDKVGDLVWRQATAAIGSAMKAGHDPTAGIIEAVELCGAALKAHYPAEGPRAHVFRARPVEI